MCRIHDILISQSRIRSFNLRHDVGAFIAVCRAHDVQARVTANGNACGSPLRAFSDTCSSVCGAPANNFFPAASLSSALPLIYALASCGTPLHPASACHPTRLAGAASPTNIASNLRAASGPTSQPRHVPPHFAASPTHRSSTPVPWMETSPARHKWSRRFCLYIYARVIIIFLVRRRDSESHENNRRINDDIRSQHVGRKQIVFPIGEFFFFSASDQSERTLPASTTDFRNGTV